jgi:flagellar protein FlaG
LTEDGEKAYAFSISVGIKRIFAMTTTIQPSSAPGMQASLQGSASAAATAPRPQVFSAAGPGTSGAKTSGNPSPAVSAPAAAPNAVAAGQAAKTAIAQQAQQKAQQQTQARSEAINDNQEMQKRLEEAVRRLNDQMQQSQRSLGFSVDKETDILIVRVTNKETGELVRQIPAEAVVRLSKSVEDLKGLLFDEAL